MEKKFRFRVLMVLALVFGLTAGAANARLIAYEPFDYPVDDVLEGQDGGTGFDNGWTGGNYGVVPQMYAGNLDMPVYGTYGTGNHLELVAVNATGTELYMQRELATPLLDDGSTYWISYQYQKANGDNVGWSGMLLGNMWFGKGFQQNGDTFAISAIANPDGGGPLVRATTEASGGNIGTGSYVIITDTTDYNGQYQVTSVSDTQFDFTHAFTTTQTGNATVEGTWHDFQILHDEQDEGEYSITDTPPTTLALVVLKVETNGTEDEDRVYMWVDPPPGETPDTGFYTYNISSIIGLVVPGQVAVGEPNEVRLTTADHGGDIVAGSYVTVYTTKLVGMDEFEIIDGSYKVTNVPDNTHFDIEFDWLNWEIGNVATGNVTGVVSSGADAFLLIPMTEEEDWDDDTTVDYELDLISVEIGSGADAGANANDCKFDEIRIGTLYQDVAGHGKLATNPQPADEATDVDLSTALVQWTAPVFGNGNYDVYFGTYGAEDPNFIIANTKIKSDAAGTTAPLPGLSLGTQYYWRVHPYTGPITGGIWTFTTWPTAPIITTQPAVVQTVQAGTGASLTVVSGGNVGGGHTYQWYEESAGIVSNGGKYSGATTATLNISNVQVGEEGYYYCEVSNPASTDSDSGRLLTKRRMAWWKFDTAGAGNYHDEEGAYDAKAAVAGNPPSFVTGIDGQAVKIEDPNRFIMVDGTIGLLNDITVSMWVEPNEVAAALLFVPQEGDPDYGGTASVDLSLFTWYTDPNATFTGLVTDGIEGDMDDARNSVTVGVWNHVVFVYDTTNQVARHHVNGKLVAIDGVYERPIDAAVLPNVLPLGIGARSPEEPGSIFGEGLIDDVRVYNYPLSPVKIAQMYTDSDFAGGTVCFVPVEGDVNGDCFVNWLDVKVTADTWLDCNLLYAGGAVDYCLDPVIPD